MAPQVWMSLSVSAAIALTSTLVLYRMRRKNNEILRAKRDLIILETALKEKLNTLIETQQNQKETWLRPALAEVRRLDFSQWKTIEIGKDIHLVVISQLWYLLEWLTIRENPAFKEFVDHSENTGAETRMRIVILFNNKKVPDELKKWLKNDLGAAALNKHVETMEMMREYLRLRKKIKSFPLLPF